MSKITSATLLGVALMGGAAAAAAPFSGEPQTSFMYGRSSTYLRQLLQPVAGTCVCGYQPNNHCVNGKVYQFSYCRDSNGQDCGTSDVDTGNTC
jgi:hypothetical protein